MDILKCGLKKGNPLYIQKGKSPSYKIQVAKQ